MYYDEEKKLIVTQHPTLVKCLVESGLVSPEVPIVGHVTSSELTGKIVYGNLPVHLASAADYVVDIPLIVPAKFVGHELTAAEIRQFTRPELGVYRVVRVDTLEWRPPTTE